MLRIPRPSAAAWSLHLFLPLSCLAFFTSLMSLLGRDASPEACMTAVGIQLFAAYGMMLLFNLTSLFEIGFDVMTLLKTWFVGLAMPLMLCPQLHQDYSGIHQSAWQEAVVPAIIALWTGTAAVLVLAWIGDARYGIRRRWTTLISFVAVALTFAACMFYDNLALTGTLWLCTLPVIYAGLRARPVIAH